MRQAIQIAFALLGLLYSHLIWAADSCPVDPRYDFQILFTIENSQRQETLYGVKAVGNKNVPVPIWTNDASVPAPGEPSPFVRDPGAMQVGNDYTIGLYFDASSSTLDYYLYAGMDTKSPYIYKEENIPANMKGIHPNKVKISGNGTATLDCLTGTEPPPPLPDICPFFPEELQSNRYYQSGGNWIMRDGALNITQGLVPASRIILERSKSSIGLGFAYSTVSGIPDSGCVYPSSGSAAESCKVDSSRVLFPDGPPDFARFVDSGSNVYAPASLTSGFYSAVTFFDNTTIRLASGEYWFNELNLTANNIRLLVDGPVVINYNKINFGIQSGTQSGVYLNASSNPAEDANYSSSDLTLIGAGGESFFWPQSIKDIRVNANIYVPSQVPAGFDINDVEDFQMNGAITAPVVNFRAKGNSYIHAVSPDGCGTLPPDPQVARIEIKPFNYHLTCESSPDNIVEVHVFDSNNNYVSGYQPALQQSSGSNLSISFLSEANGIARYRVIQNEQSSVGEYPLTASLSVGGANLTDNDVIKYVPYKFEVADQYITAGEKVTFPIDVKACSNSGQLISLGYTGEPTASFSYQQPLAPELASDLQFSAKLSNTNRNAEMIFKESGHIKVQIQDQSFVCDQDNCPVEGGALKGEFDVYSRPWKLAICDVVQASNIANLNPATTSSGTGFIAAGEPFNVTYRPIVHPDSRVNETDECKYPLTGNYSLDKGPIELSYSVAYPTSSLTSLGALSSVPLTPFETNSETKTVEHSWSEAGTLQLQTTANYLTMDIDIDSQAIGRFYPAKLVMQPVSEQWQYATGHDGFAYMSQPITHAFAVEAQNVEGNPTFNYGLFSDALIVDLQYTAKEQASGDSLTNRLLGSDNWNSGVWGTSADWLTADSGGVVNSSRLGLAVSDFSFEKQTVTHASGNYTSQPDGPFDESNAWFGLNIVDDPDGIRFLVETDNAGVPTQSFELEDAFPEQPDFRYGRMRLQDSGTTTGVNGLKIPLKVEHWDNNRFVTNTADSNSDFDGADYCKQVIWPDSLTSSAAVLQGQGSVTNGQSNNLTVDHNGTEREQVRIWARINPLAPVALSGENPISCGSDGNIPERPWLRYNWRNNGDEDPPAVITFGIFRGNDKVIFRGEPGLIGL